jgi:TRAP-type C4-dicarboxylate transport system permease large subunit
MLSKMLGPVWVGLLGVVVLFGFFAALGMFSPEEVMWLTVAVAALVVLFGIRSLMMRRQLHQHGNQDLFRSLNGLRERRGF